MTTHTTPGTPTALESKYHLKTLHADIDLFDRRLAHLLKYEVFATETARTAAARKITLKRDPLVATAKRLAAEGVEFKESELPRSFRPEGVPAPVEAKVAEPEPAAAAAAPHNPLENRSARRQGSPYAGTSLDWEKSVQHYMQNKAAKA
jgi:ABC-type uncharacterized transport system involved in gliding motility auxiliary subunit